MPDEKVDQGGGQSEEGKETVTPPEFNPGDFTLKVNGNDITVKDRDELINLAQMGHDYTQKTQTLSQDRDAFNRKVEDRAIDLYKQALEDEGKGGKSSQGTQEDEDPNAKLREELNSVKDKLSTFEQSRSDESDGKALDGMLNTFKSQDAFKGMGKMDERIILLRFSEQANNESDINQLMGKLFQERANEKATERQSIIDDYVKTKTKDPFASGETGKSGSSVSELAKNPTTFKEARDRADARFKAGT